MHAVSENVNKHEEKRIDEMAKKIAKKRSLEEKKRGSVLIRLKEFVRSLMPERKMTPRRLAREKKKILKKAEKHRKALKGEREKFILSDREKRKLKARLLKDFRAEKKRRKKIKKDKGSFIGRLFKDRK